MLQRPGDELFELVGVERFFDVVERPVPHGFDRRSDRGMGRDHQNLGSVRPMLERTDEFQAAHAGHPQIGNHHVVTFGGQASQAPRAPARQASAW